MIPEKYRKSPEAIQSYDWNDIADGIGMVNFYPIGDGTNDTTAGSLIKGNLSATIYAHGFTVSFLGASKTVTFLSNPFKSTRVLKGTCYLSCALGIKGADSGGANTGVIITGCKITKVSGGSDTDLGTFGNSVAGYFSVIQTAPSSFKNGVVFVCTPEINDTVFKYGDQIKLSITFSKDGTDSPQQIILYHNPGGEACTMSFNDSYSPYTSRDYTASITKTVLSVPFKIDT